MQDEAVLCEPVSLQALGVGLPSPSTDAGLASPGLKIKCPTVEQSSESMSLPKTLSSHAEVTVSISVSIRPL